MTYDEISCFCMQIYFLIHAGMDVNDALSLTSEEIEAEWFEKISRQVDEGASFSEALKASGVFPTYMCGLIEVGEKTGHLENVLLTLSEYYERQSKFSKYLRGMLMYPLVMLVLMFVVIGVILVKVMPVFDDVYASFGARLSGVSRGLLLLGQWLDRILPFLFVGLLAGVAAAAVLIKSGRVRGTFDKGIARVINNARIAQAMSLGTSSGMDLRESMELASMLVADAAGAQSRCRKCMEFLDAGENQSDALNKSGIFGRYQCRFLEFGQRSGAEDASMDKLARDMLADSETKVDELVSRIEPTLVLICSALVGVLLLSVMLPLMNIISAIG